MTASAFELIGAGRSYVSGGVSIAALKATSLRVATGEWLSIMGPSGSGKSTLLNLLGLLVRPTVGRIEVDGLPTHNLGDSGLSRLRGEAVGFVFQDYHLLPDLSLIGNVELPLAYAGVQGRRRRALARSALTDVGLEDRCYALPRELSGGERQRVAIARAIARRPRTLLCDEPTGNLDESSSERVVSLLRGLNEGGLGLVLVTHNPEIAALAVRRLQVRDGVVTELTQ